MRMEGEMELMLPQTKKHQALLANHQELGEKHGHGPTNTLILDF